MTVIVHMKNNLHPTESVCGDPHAGQCSSNIDNVNCVDCLRKLVKDAVIYGVDRRAKKR